MEGFVILASAVVLIISTCGVLGNGLSLRVAMTAADVKTTFSLLFILMLIADMVHLVLGVILQMYVLVSPEHNSIVVLAAMLDFVSNIALLSVAGLAIDRFLALKKTSYFVNWNSSCGMTLMSLIIVFVSCGMTPWGSHITLDTRCTNNDYVILNESIRYAASITVAAMILGVTCVLTKWIVKLDRTVLDIQIQHHHGTAGQCNQRNVIQSFKVIRWVILEEILASSILHSVVFATIFNDSRCLSSITPLWWYQLVQVTSKADKPFILMLVSKHFRESAVNVCSRHAPHRPNSLFCSDGDNTGVPAPSHSRRMEANSSRFAVTSVDSNPLACINVEDQKTNAAVATFQGRPYPFKRSMEFGLVGNTPQNRPPISRSSSSSVIDSGPIDIDSSFPNATCKLGVSLQDPLPGHDAVHSFGSQKDGEETISVNFKCNFELVIGNQRKSTLSCPDLQTDENATNHLNNNLQTKKRYSIAESRSDMPKIFEGWTSPYHLPPLVHKGSPHPGTRNGNGCKKDSVLICHDENGSNESIHILHKFSLKPQVSPSRITSTCNLAKNKSLSLSSINDIPYPTPDAMNECVQNQVHKTSVSDVFQSPCHSIPDIVLINAQNISTQVLVNPSDKSNAEAEPLGSPSPSPRQVTHTEQLESQGASGHLHNICSVGMENEREKNIGSQMQPLKSKGRRYSFQNPQNKASRTKQRHASESVKDKKHKHLDAQKLGKDNLVVAPPLLHISAFARPSLLDIDSKEYPPELKLAFGTPRQSTATDGSSWFSFSASQQKELQHRIQTTTRGSLPHAVDSPLGECDPLVLTRITSPLEHVDIVSRLSSPCTPPNRKRSDSIYDPDSHVYLGTNSVNISVIP